MRNNYSCRGESVICINTDEICDKDLKLLWILNFTLTVVNSYNGAEFLTSCGGLTGI